MIRGAIYVRVSTKEQTTENQERELRQWAERLGFEVVAVYADTMSGARSDRAALAAVLTAAHRREFDVLLVWALDRVSREGIGPMVGFILATCARIAGEWDRALSDRFAVLSTGEKYLIRLEAVRGLDDAAAERLMQRLGAADPSHEKREKWVRVVTDLPYCAALVALVAGMVSVFWRVLTC